MELHTDNIGRLTFLFSAIDRTLESIEDITPAQFYCLLCLYQLRREYNNTDMPAADIAVRSGNTIVGVRQLMIILTTTGYVETLSAPTTIVSLYHAANVYRETQKAQYLIRSFSANYNRLLKNPDQFKVRTLIGDRKKKKARA